MSGDVVWVDVLPGMSGFATKLAKDSATAAADAGRKSGAAWSQGLTAGASGGAALVADLTKAEQSGAKVVQTLASQISQARAAERNAAAGVLLAEQKLTDARARYGADSAQAQAADLRLQAARDKVAGATTKYTSVETQLKAAQREHTEVARQLAAASEDLANATDKQPSRWARFKESLTSSKVEVEQTGTSMTKLSVIAGAVGGMVSNVFNRGVDAIAALGSEAVNASDSTDKFRNTLSFAGLDTSTIANVTKQTRAYADQTVYDMADIQNITAQLAANGIGNYEGLAEAAGNLNAIAGGNKDTFKSVGMVLTQTAGQGKLTTENWNQLADAIPGASGKLQGALKDAGAYTGNFRDAMEKGQISADEFNLALLQLGTQPVAVEAAKSTTTFEGALGNLKATVVGGLSDALTYLKPQLTGAISGAADFAKGIGGIASILLSGDFKGADATFGLQEDSTAVDVLFRIRDGLIAAGDKATSLVKGLGGVASILLSGDFKGAVSTFGWEEDSAQVDVLFRIRDGLVEVKDVAAGALSGFGDYLTGSVIPGLQQFGDWIVQNRDWLLSLAVGVGTVVVGWKAYEAAMWAYQTYTKIATAVQLAFNAVMAMNPIVLVVAAVAALVAGLIFFFTQTDAGKRIWGEFTDFLAATWVTITTALTAAWTGISSFFATVWDGIKAGAGFVWDVIQALFAWSPIGIVVTNWGAISGFFATVWDGIKTGASWVWNLLQTIFAWSPIGIIVTNWDSIVGFFTQLPGRISGAVSGLWDGLTSSFKAAINTLIGLWNSFHLTLGGGEVLGMKIPSVTLDTPDLPYLASGGTAVQPGWSVVGEKGPELAYLNVGATVVPLNQRSQVGTGNPMGAGVYIAHAELGGSLDEFAAEVEWGARR